MDLSSSDKYSEEIVKEDDSPIEEDLDLKSSMVKTDQEGEKFQHEGEVPTGMQVDAHQALDSPIQKSDSAEKLSHSRKTEEAFVSHDSELQHDDDRRISDHNSQRISSLVDDYYYDNKVNGNGFGFTPDLVDKNADETFGNEVEDENSDPCLQKTLMTVNRDNSYEILNKEGLNGDIDKSHSPNETNRDLGVIPGNSDLENIILANKEKDDGNLSCPTELKEGINAPEVVLSDQEGTVVGTYSSLETQNAMLSPGQQLNSKEESPHTEPYAQSDPSAGKEEFPSPVDDGKKLVPSPRPSKRKHSHSPERHTLNHKKASLHDRSSPPVRQRSPSGRKSDSHHRDRSPRKQSSLSPRRHESPRRKDRSASRSPVRRRDSSRHRRDRRGRSRSRSPYERDRYRRSPRRRHSPRRRSPYSHRRSPRRPWSPPANRSTGVGKPGRNLFVAGFSYITTERDLEKKFSRYGRVTDIRIVRDRRSGESRGFGFLSLERDEDADAAIRALDQTEWNGRIVLVEKSKSSVR